MKRFSQAVRVAYAEHRRSRRLRVVLAAFVVFLGVVVAAQLTPGRSPATAPSTGEGANGTRNAGDFALVRRDPNDSMAVGDVDAPVVLVQWTDMRCPYCAVFNRETLPPLLREYVQTGKARIEVRDVAYFGEQSTDGAVAARAAGNQGKFFAYLSAVYADVPAGVHPDLPRERLIAYARKAGVPDIERFTADLTDAELHAAVRDSHATAEQLGVTSVPFFVVGDSALAGAQPIEVFRKFLDDAIAKAR
ncbi:DsbA family protein [Micromonospora eburnea]|uniref:DsbA family protein n=1 Tax=Micromonospora eburnea TaxID=227316 RepID=UPI001ABFB04E|nr:thioredoxin domain-containing protein [Micromonospora eburnea]